MSLGGKSPKNKSTSLSSSRSRSFQRIGQDRLSQDLLGRLVQQAGAGPGDLAQVGTQELQRTAQGGGFGDIAGRLEAISAPAIRNLQRSVLPSITGQFAGDALQGRGGEVAAIADAQEGVAGQIAAQAAGLQEAERGRQFSAAGALPGLDQIGLDRLTQIAGALPGLRTSESSSLSRSKSKSKQTAGKKGKGGALGSLAGGAVGTIFGPVGTAIGTQLGGTITDKLFGPQPAGA